ncbi:MAG: lysis protein [Pigmentiphaga sp.]
MTARTAIAAGVAAVLLLGAGTAGWMLRGWRAEAQIATMVAQHATAMQGYADDAYRASQRLIERQEQHQQAVAAIDAQHTEELTHANQEIDNLRAAVAAGQRLRVNAVCPAPAVGVSGAAGTASMDDAAGPRLTGAAERDYFALRERIARADAMIRGLQDYVRGVCLANTKETGNAD